MAKKNQTPKPRKNPYAFASRKMEQQFKELRSRFRITRTEFAQYYNDIRRANKKGQNLKRYEGALYIPKYSLSVASIRTRSDFTARVKSVENVLAKGYRQRVNTVLRNRFFANLSYAYGRDADAVINIFMTMSDAQMEQWLRQNKDIEIAYYDSDAQAVAQYLNTIGMSATAFIKRANV